MFAVYAAAFDPTDPLAGLAFGDRPDPALPRDDWTTVTVRATALNHHDLWSLQGVGLSAEELPRILGCDAAGVDADGNDVVVHAVISEPSWLGDETLDPKRSLLSERYDGTFAERVAVPRRNLIPKPPALSWEEAACLPTAYLTAYRMLFGQGRLKPGDSVLVQGAGGMRVFATSRDEDKRKRALSIGAHAAVETGARLPHRVDAVMETVGEATWSHSIKSLRPGGTLVLSGATSGEKPSSAELRRIFYLSMRIQGSTMGTRDELGQLASFLDVTGVRPLIDRTLPLDEARDGFAAMARGDLFGKVVLTL